MTQEKAANLKSGDIIRDDNDNRYLIVRVCPDRGCLEVMDGHFDKMSIGFNYIDQYYYYESTDINFYKNWFSGEPDTDIILAKCYQIIGEYNMKRDELADRVKALEKRLDIIDEVEGE